MTDYTCIQKHRLYHIDIKYYNLYQEWELITSSSKKNTMNIYTTIVILEELLLVLILLRPRVSRTLINVDKINTKLIVANFTGNLMTTITSCNSLTSIRRNRCNRLLQ